MNYIHQLHWYTIRYRAIAGKAVRRFLCTLMGAIVFVTAFDCTHLYLWSVSKAQAEVAKVEADNAELLCVLNRKCGMAAQAGKYVVVESVTYEVAK